MSSTVNNGAASMPSPPDAANGFPQPGASSGNWPRAEEEMRAAEPGLVKRAHREILDHERKRRVELKCMELQEMMEEQGYSEEETRQKVRTFRQMLMEKEGMLTREDRPGGHIVAETPRLPEGAEPAPPPTEPLPFTKSPPITESPTLALTRRRPQSCSVHLVGTPLPFVSSLALTPTMRPWQMSGGPTNSVQLSVLLSPLALSKKRRLDSECSCGSSSPLRKKKKSVKKHRKDRSDSGSRRKRRHRSRSPKSKRKEKNKERKRPHESPGRRSHRHSSGSSHSPSLSSQDSDSRSPSRQSPKHRGEGRKTGSQRSSGSQSPSLSGGSGWGSPQQNGGSRQRSGAHRGRPGSAHSPPDVRTPGFAEGSRATRGCAVLGRGESLRGRGLDKDGEGRARHAEAEAARARRRSRSYSPIRKRRRDSPSFMEPRRITSARKRPIPYYRPSPSSSSSSCLSSDYSSRSPSRSPSPSPGHSHGSYSSRSRGTRSRTRSPSRTPSPSYHSRSSSESGGF
ncbi:PREDICTED: serine/arginine repetitive matrix protein 3 [Miniopterus natalensis]|uniref:serine/arginine repetitive matrix protein 3 n=1 Tax=Miniopterus natalensis TaxID=291302 RepID=UPI0007A72D32|nr:PREDICTED: serine/arginine repetitive matrix protein 3 [Miniopterus natalensis]